MSDFKIGDIVVYTGNLKGTVEFVGTTHFAAGTWYGVKLDLPKGKNDGSVAGKSYFKCEKNHGIFVRNTQLTKVENEESTSNVLESKVRPSALRKPTVIKNRIYFSNNDITENLNADTPKEEIKEILEKNNEDIELKSEKLQEIKEPVNCDEQVKDLTEKLQTLQIKRSEDKEKLKDFEKLKMKTQQLEENKKLIQEKAAEYQRSLDKLKQEHAKLTEEFDNYREETATLADNIEMLTIDKEMAEEKLETYRSEIDLLKSKNEEISLENEILKLEKGGSSDVVLDEAQFVMLKSQNTKLRDAIILMRDLSESQKAEIEKNAKEISKLQAELEKCNKERDRLIVDLKVSQESIIELKEQVDSALGADEMVSNLTEKNLSLEESVRALEEAKIELEELYDMSNEINENNASLMSELKLEIANKDLSIQELNKVLVAKNECIFDYEDTIEKFRDLVRDLQTQLKDLKQQTNLNSESLKNQSQISIEKSSEIYKTKIHETKTVASVIEAELQKLEVSQSTNHVQMLERFLPDKFFKTGSDNDSIMMILLIDKLIYKIDFLCSQIRERFLLPSSQDTAADPTAPNISDESKSYYYRLVYLLSTWYIILRHYKKTLSSCQLATFSRLGSLFIEMSPNEKSVDYLIELLKKGNLDENSSLEPLERSFNYFQTFYQVHLVNEVPDYNLKMNDLVRIMLCGADNMDSCCKYITEFLKKHNKEDTGTYEFITKLQQFGIDLRINTKDIRKHLLKSPSLQFSSNLSISMDKCITDLSAIVKIVNNYSSQLASLSDEDDGVLLELPTIFKLVEKFMEIRNVLSTQPVFLITENILKVSANISNSMEHGEYDFEGTTNKIEEPIITIANNFKTELSDLENTCYKLEHKDEELRQAKVNLKMKCDELSEMTVRLNIAEKKLSTNVKEKDEIIERLEQKLEQTKAALIRKEKELDQTSEALQSDINHLEFQKEELKRQLKETKKRNFIDNINLSSSKMSEQVDSPSQEMGAFSTEIQTLRLIIQNLRNQIQRLRSQISTKHIEKMKDFNVPVKSTQYDKEAPKHNPELIKIEKLISKISDSEKLSRDIYSHLSEIKIIDLSAKCPSKCYMQELSVKANIKIQFEKLRREKNDIINEDCLFNKIYTASNQVVSTTQKGGPKTDCIGSVKFLADSDHYRNTKFISGSRLTIAKLHNIFSY